MSIFQAQFHPGLPCPLLLNMYHYWTSYWVLQSSFNYTMPFPYWLPPSLLLSWLYSSYIAISNNPYSTNNSVFPMSNFQPGFHIPFSPMFAFLPSFQPKFATNTAPFNVGLPFEFPNQVFYQYYTFRFPLFSALLFAYYYPTKIASVITTIILTLTINLSFQWLISNNRSPSFPLPLLLILSL